MAVVVSFTLLLKLAMTFNTWLDPFIDQIALILQNLPPIAPLFLLIIEEIGVPLPIPSDVFIAYTGYRITLGETSFTSVLTILVISIMCGATILFFLARQYGQQIIIRFGRFIHVSEESIKRVEKRFKRSAFWAIIIGRQIPLLRTPVTIFAGMSNVPYSVFFISTLISSIVASAFYLYLGMILGERISTFMHTFSHTMTYLAVPVLIGFCVYSLWRHYRRK